MTERIFLVLGRLLWIIIPALLVFVPFLIFTEPGTWQRWLAGGIIVAIIWRFKLHRKFFRRASRLRMQAKIHNFLSKQGLWQNVVPQVTVKSGARRGTYRVRVRVPGGASPKQVADIDDVIAAHLDAVLCQPAQPGIQDSRGNIAFDLAMKPGVLVEENLTDPLPDASRADDGSLSIPAGMDTLGNVISISPYTPRAGAMHVWVCGTNGTGKSSVSALLARTYLDHGLLVFAYDPDAASLKNALAECNHSAEDTSDAESMLEKAVEEMRRRQQGLKHGEMPRPGLILIEEAESLINESKKAKSSIALLAKQARKSGLSLCLVSQDTTGEAVGGTAVRDQMRVRFVFPLPSAKAGLAGLDDSGADLADRLRSAPPGACLLADATVTSEVSGSCVAIRMRPANAFVQPVAPPTVEEMVDDVLEAADLQDDSLTKEDT